MSVYVFGLVCWSLASLCHSNEHMETMPAREINPFTALTRIRSQFLRTQWSTSNHQRVDTTTPLTAQPSGLSVCMCVKIPLYIKCRGGGGGAGSVKYARKCILYGFPFLITRLRIPLELLSLLISARRFCSPFWDWLDQSFFLNFSFFVGSIYAITLKNPAEFWRVPTAPTQDRHSSIAGTCHYMSILKYIATNQILINVYLNNDKSLGTYLFMCLC